MAVETVSYFSINDYLCAIMSDFIVSARKYRPTTFSSVVGQQHITSTLRNAIERGQLAHAYLFCGPRGVGKTTCARIFAKAINCLNPVGAEACNECESCRSFNEGRSLNIHELDAASNNSVEDIRTLIEQVRIIPQLGQYSVFIIDEVHMLSQAAFNAFLKTLEEPPQHAIFILATTEKHKIIPTILSRCQIYDFNRIRVEDGVAYLKEIAAKEGITADEESLNLIAQKADGGMRDALSMFDKAVSFCGTTLDYRNVARTLNVLDYDTYFSVTDQLRQGLYTDVLIQFDEVLSKGFSGQTFMAGLNRHLRDLLMAKRPDTLRLIEMTGTLMERYRTQAGTCTVEFLFGAISILTELDGKIRQSSNRRLLVELGLMKISGLGQKKIETSLTGEYALPSLDAPRTQGAVQQGGATTTPQQTTTAEVTQQPRPATSPSPQPRSENASGHRSISVSISDSIGGLSGLAKPKATPAEAQPKEGQPAEAQHPTEVQRPTEVKSKEVQSTTEAQPAVQAATAHPSATAPTKEMSEEIAKASAQAMTQPATATTHATAQPSATAQPTTASPSQATATEAMPQKPAKEETPLPADATPQPTPMNAPKAELAPMDDEDDEEIEDAVVEEPSEMTSRRSPILGASLSEMLASANQSTQAGENTATASKQEVVIDPLSEEKLNDSRHLMMEQIQQRRPRFVPAFEQMTIKGNTISVSVPTEELREEILRTRNSMLRCFVDLAGIQGLIQLEVTVNETIKASRPIKLEDRVKYMTEKNPLLLELRKKLDLDVD